MKQRMTIPAAALALCLAFALPALACNGGGGGGGGSGGGGGNNLSGGSTSESTTPPSAFESTSVPVGWGTPAEALGTFGLPPAPPDLSLPPDLLSNTPLPAVGDMEVRDDFQPDMQSAGTGQSLEDSIAMDQEQDPDVVGPDPQVQVIDPHIPMVPGPAPGQTDREVRGEVNEWMAGLSPEERSHLNNVYNPHEIQRIRYIREFQNRINQMPPGSVRQSWQAVADQRVSQFHADVRATRVRIQRNLADARENVQNIRDFVAGASVNVFTAPLGAPGAVINLGINIAAGGRRGGRTAVAASQVRGPVDAAINAMGPTARAVNQLTAPVVDAVVQEVATRIDKDVTND